LGWAVSVVVAAYISSFASRWFLLNVGNRPDPNGLPLFGGWLLVLIVVFAWEAMRQHARFPALWALLAVLPYTGWALYGWARGNQFHVGRGFLIMVGLVVIESGLFWVGVLGSLHYALTG